MSERFEIYIVYKRRYINTLPFLSFTKAAIKLPRAGDDARSSVQYTLYLVLNNQQEAPLQQRDRATRYVS